MNRPKLVVLGAGSWGTALAQLASHNCDVRLWTREADVVASINQQHCSPRYLPGIRLSAQLQATSDLDQALAHVLSEAAHEQRIILLAVPMAGLGDVCQLLAQKLPAATSDLHLIWVCKGISPDTWQWPHQIVDQHLPDRPELRTGVLSGPSFALEVARGLPVGLTIASQSAATGQLAQLAFHGQQARIYTSTDIIGVEVGGALKNVIAIACGISDGLGLGTNARAALITRGLAEIQQLGVVLGAQAETFMGLTGLGDLVLTATGDLSRNRQVGLAIAKGKALADILAGGMTAEGVRCAHAALQLAHRHKLDLPIIQAVNDVLAQRMTPRQAVDWLLSREARDENPGT